MYPIKQAALVNKPHDICYNRGCEIDTDKFAFPALVAL